MYTQSITRNHRTAFILAIDGSGSMAESILFRGRCMTKAEAVATITNDLLFELVERARRSDGAVTYSAVLPRRAELPAEVSLTLTEERGYAGGAAIDGPVKLVCGVGRYTVGDWCRNDALRTYSGAAWYGRDFTLTKKPAGRVTLDLGEVVSTARVLVNGREAGLRLTPPWRFDVTGLLQEGANRIEIRVCNTTANIFLSSPTVYRGGTKAGILGPVRIEIAE
jgi:hypothetical protein